MSHRELQAGQRFPAHLAGGDIGLGVLSLQPTDGYDPHVRYLEATYYLRTIISPCNRDEPHYFSNIHFDVFLSLSGPSLFSDDMLLEVSALT